MKLTFEPDDVELTIRIDGGILTFTDVDSGYIIDANLSESDMDYLKKRLVECWNHEQKG